MKKLIHEIHRRSLWQVLGIYVLGSWVALQVVDVLASNFGLPEWFPAFALALLVIGLPIVLATAFVQEGVRTKDAPAETVEAQGGSTPAVPLSPRRLLTWRKAIGGGVAAFALWGLLVTGWLLFGPRAGRQGGEAVAEVTVPDLRSVAVLPFATRSEEKQDEYFSEGMHDDLLTQLSKIDSLIVISRTSVMQYAGTRRPIREIAAELGVATVLEGGVDRAGDRVRVNVQLIDARTDEHLWAETYDQELTAANVFAIRTDLARQIAHALRARLTPEVDARIAERPTESLEAYDLYARAHYTRHTGEDYKVANEEAARLFRLAIEADPEFPLAYTGLAAAHLGLVGRGYEPPEEGLPAARTAVARALELDPELSEAHSARAAILHHELRFDEAERANVRAIELNPGSAQAHARYGSLLGDLGRFDEATAEYRRAVKLDPLSLTYRANLAFTYAMGRQFDAAIEQARKLIELEPEYGYGHYALAASLSFRGDHEAAIVAAERAVELEPDDLYNLAGLAFTHAKAGHRDTALALAAEVERRGAALAPFSEIGLVHAALGDLDEAFEYLDRAYQAEAGSLRLLNVDPSADPLRDDPRFAELLEKIGLE